MLSETDKQVWEKLWSEVFNSYYRAYFEELCSDFLLRRSKLLDFLTKAFTGITASGSTIAGFAFWEQGGYKQFWLILASTAALLAIIHMSVNASEKVMNESIAFSKFRDLRQELEALTTQMEIRSFDSISTCREKYIEILDRYRRIQSARPDILLTKNREKKLQDELNRRLGYEQ